MKFVKGQIVSVIYDQNLKYPWASESFSPDQAFPEYQFGHIAKNPNPVYAAVRQCLIDAGLDMGNFGKSTWNPLRNYITPGQKIFILCNFVQHNIKRVPEIMSAKCTHGAVVRALIDYVLIALCGSGSVRFGNAPLQSADWERVTRETGAQNVEEFYTRSDKKDVTVQLVDLRQHIVHRNTLGVARSLYHEDDAKSCIPVDLGSDSLLDELYESEADPHFRVLDYDHRRIERCHSKGRHVYLVNKMILESDVIVSIPKLKTHEKVGFTCGIKGCVGAVGHKDSLAHHRFGPPNLGGDEYPNEFSPLMSLSKLHDAAYSSSPSQGQKSLQLLNNASRKMVRRFTRSLSGSWPGNDTCWRMAVDLARIVEYANAEGQLYQDKQRFHLMLTDGIVGGEGDGPLSPRPVSLGYLSFSDNVAVGDYVSCLFMGFAPEKIPIIREAFRLGKYRLAATTTFESTIRVNGEDTQSKDVASILRWKFLPPREWRRYL